MKIGLIITAAGTSSRFGRNKLLAEIHGKSVFACAVSCFLNIPEIVDVVITANPQTKGLYEDELKAHGLPGRVILGGATRKDSVQTGFQSLKVCDAVMVHDAARPFVSTQLISTLIEAAGQHGAVIPGVPVVDTIKEVRGSVVTRTVDRESLRAIQTPQVFSYDVLARAYENSDVIATDEAMLIEALGEAVIVVPGDSRNIKITQPSDL
ncbi:MAG: 2-C-methyl-D-erythritol 4-phosphate cytidylyltransferase [bacterium]|nr:2-C-methyl-D-erythritol 4-phosphate cytidylyltransferase [bacterium]